MIDPAIIVHGGARPIAPEKAAANREGCLRAAEAGWQVLAGGGSALDAVEAAVRVLEDDPTFNAAYGATLNPDGVPRMDAAIQEGEKLRAGAVGVIEGVRHPITVARRILEGDGVLIVAHHARRIAQETVPEELCDPADLISPEQRQKWETAHRAGKTASPSHDTVGCVVRDSRGNLAAAASTGGTGDKPPGRVGDSAMAGGGFLADNTIGACALTGDGEDILRIALARTALEMLQRGLSAEDAAGKAMETLTSRTDGVGGIILMDPEGNIGWAHSDENIAVAYRTARMDAPRAFLHKDEEKGSEHAG